MDPAHTHDRPLALKHAGRCCSRTPTENIRVYNVTLSFPCALEHKVYLPEQVPACTEACCNNNKWLCDSIYGETLRATEQHCSILVSTGDVFWETLDKNTLSHCHIISFFSLSLYFHTLTLPLSLMHTHTQSNLTLSFKNWHHCLSCWC